MCSASLGKRRFRPRHHCRLCRQPVCDGCSRSRLELTAGEWRDAGPQRACRRCVLEVEHVPMMRSRLDTLGRRLSGMASQPEAVPTGACAAVGSATRDGQRSRRSAVSFASGRLEDALFFLESACAAAEVSMLLRGGRCRASGAATASPKGRPTCATATVGSLSPSQAAAYHFDHEGLATTENEFFPKDSMQHNSNLLHNMFSIVEPEPAQEPHADDSSDTAAPEAAPEAAAAAAAAAAATAARRRRAWLQSLDWPPAGAAGCGEEGQRPLWRSAALGVFGALLPSVLIEGRRGAEADASRPLSAACPPLPPRSGGRRGCDSEGGSEDTGSEAWCGGAGSSGDAHAAGGSNDCSGRV